MQQALSGQKARGGAGLHFLTPPITSPSLAEHAGRHPARLSEREVAPVRRGRPADRRAAAARAVEHHLPLRQGRRRRRARRRLPDAAAPAASAIRRISPARRRLTEENTSMNRLYAIESTPTLTGAKADHRLPVPAVGGRGRRARARRGVSGGGDRTPAARRPPGRRRSRRAGSRRSPRIFRPTRAARVVVAGEFQTEGVRAAAKAINDALGNTGTTVTLRRERRGRARGRRDVDRRARAGHRRRPGRAAGDHGRQSGVHRARGSALRRAAGQGPAGRLSHARTSTRPRRYCHWNVPETHPLESWGDARSFDGTVTLMQPLIEPLYEGRSAHEFLAAFTVAARAARRWRSSRTTGRRPTAAARAAGRSRIRAARVRRTPTRSGARRCTMDSSPARA